MNIKIVLLISQHLLLHNGLVTNCFFLISGQTKDAVLEKQNITSDDGIHELRNILKSIENIRKQVSELREQLSEKYAESIADNVSNCATQ